MDLTDGSPPHRMSLYGVAFLFEDILDGEEYTGLLHIAELIVDSRSEIFIVGDRLI